MNVVSPRMAKKTKPQSDQPAPGKVSVKLAADLHRKARTVASYHGLELVDFLDQQLRPIVERLFAQMGKEIQQGDG